MKLTIELVPSTSFYSNVRSNVTPSQWDKLRKASYVKAGYKCEVCGEKGKTHPVECHEVWDYITDGEVHIQRLVRLISLCPNCHKVKHPGLAQINGDSDLVVAQLMKVNNWTMDRALDYLEESFHIWHVRSRSEWELDLTYLDNN